MDNRYSDIVDCMISKQYTEWNVIEVWYNHGVDGDIAIATVCTTDGKPPKERDNSRGFTVVFNGGESGYQQALRYANHVAAEMGIRAIG